MRCEALSLAFGDEVTHLSWSAVISEDLMQLANSKAAKVVF